MLASELRPAALCCPLPQGKKKGGTADEEDPFDDPFFKVGSTIGWEIE